jgi:hypothetical protein
MDNRKAKMCCYCMEYHLDWFSWKETRDKLVHEITFCMYCQPKAKLNCTVSLGHQDELQRDCPGCKTRKLRGIHDKYYQGDDIDTVDDRWKKANVPKED